MARPERYNVDYFPFLCKEGKAMYYVEQKYGNDGYASWVKILRQLAVTNNHYLNLSNRVELMFLSSKCRVTEEVLCELISDLCVLGEFDEILWVENQIVYSSKFIDSVKDAYLNRKSNLYDYLGFLQMLSSLGFKKLPLNTEKKHNNPQRREEKIKEDNIYRTFAHLSLSKSEFEELEKLGYTQFQIDTILNSIENHKKNKSYTSLYLTSMNWLRRQFPETETPQEPKPQNPHESILQTPQYGRR